MKRIKSRRNCLIANLRIRFRRATLLPPHSRPQKRGVRIVSATKRSKAGAETDPGSGCGNRRSRTCVFIPDHLAPSSNRTSSTRLARDLPPLDTRARSSTKIPASNAARLPRHPVSRMPAVARVPLKRTHLSDKDAGQNQRVGACRKQYRRATFLRTCLSYDFPCRRAKRNRWERAAALSSAARDGSRRRWPFDGPRERWIAPFFSLWPERIPGEKPRLTSMGHGKDDFIDSPNRRHRHLERPSRGCPDTAKNAIMHLTDVATATLKFLRAASICDSIDSVMGAPVALSGPTFQPGKHQVG
jgi:hypothetical protein